VWGRAPDRTTAKGDRLTIGLSQLNLDGTVKLDMTDRHLHQRRREQPGPRFHRRNFDTTQELARS
jgi:hypothetical protein